ncbi:hypothetical protein BJX62DRAFT_202956 [Aspergillus germanicus]
MGKGKPEGIGRSVGKPVGRPVGRPVGKPEVGKGKSPVGVGRPVGTLPSSSPPPKPGKPGN